MTPENRDTLREADSKTPDVPITKNSDAAQEVTVITLGGILKFALFFTACLALALLFVTWYLGYFHEPMMR